MSKLTLEQRLERMEAVAAIQRLKAQYCAYCDNKYEPEPLANLFTPDGIWDGEELGRFVGRDEIRGFFRRISGEVIFAAHLVLNPIIEVQDADHATGKWRLIMPATALENGRKEARWLVGAYDERYVCVNGVWLFQVMHLHPNFYVSHAAGWADVAVA